MAKRLFLVTLFLAILFGGIFGWKHYMAQQRMAAQAGGMPAPVIAASVVRSDTWTPEISTVGSLVAVSGIEVTNEVSGTVSGIHITSGRTVAEGDLLLQLEDSSDRATLEGLVAERRLAELKFERVASLFPKKSVSQSEYDEARALLDGATAKVTAQQALIGKKQIRAPFSGQLGIRRVDLGEFLSPGSDIVPLEQLDPIHADFSLPERELARVAVGQIIQVRVQSQPDVLFEGTISAIDPGVDTGTRSFRVRATLSNPDKTLRPGMFAEIRVLMPEALTVLTIPGTAVSYNPYGNFVFAINDQDGANVVERRQIETGTTKGDRVAVISGLEEGDRVVSAGQVKLRNGQTVEIDSKPSPADRTDPGQAAIGQ